MKVAGIDCGTNTIRLLIAETIPQKTNTLGAPILNDVLRKMEVVRLGAGLDRTGKFNDEALTRALNTVKNYANLCQENNVESIRFAATSATRDAANRNIFIQGVSNLLGIEPQVISGEQEAITSFTGAICAFEGRDAKIESPIITVDLGGGSTELTLGTADGNLISAFSMNVGSVRMHERHLGIGKASIENVEAARKDIRDCLDLAEETVDFGAARTLIGLAGTVTTITAKWLGLRKYDPSLIHGAKMTLSQVRETCQWFIDSDTNQRAAIEFMHPGRVDVINAGALIWQEVVERIAMRTAEAGHPLNEVITSEHDILDGLALWAATEIQYPKYVN